MTTPQRSTFFTISTVLFFGFLQIMAHFKAKKVLYPFITIVGLSTFLTEYSLVLYPRGLELLRIRPDFSGLHHFALVAFYKEPTGVV